MSDNLKKYFLLVFLVVWGAFIGLQFYGVYKHFTEEKVCRADQNPELPIEYYLPWGEK